MADEIKPEVATLVRPRSESPQADQPTKRQKVEEEPTVTLSLEEELASNTLAPSAYSGLPGSNLPQSSYIFANPDGQIGKLDHGDGVYHLREGDVGISGYLTRGAGEVNGIIKQSED
ncbi:hypothetical protein QFC21_003025 [Naganishia friedmannii]|uniref:Uncharacterized protein n=1 Tax=Naganishia friedmannii TaxID=89922 RepID=A0ACC2VTB2_9TREE|nr:hypothetical protein QFC21_003025 [Naganishia friedmannii]